MLHPKEIGRFRFVFIELWYKLLLFQSFFPDHVVPFPSETRAAVSRSGILQVRNLLMKMSQHSLAFPIACLFVSIILCHCWICSQGLNDSKRGQCLLCSRDLKWCVPSRQLLHDHTGKLTHCFRTRGCQNRRGSKNGERLSGVFQVKAPVSLDRWRAAVLGMYLTAGTGRIMRKW